MRDQTVEGPVKEATKVARKAKAAPDGTPSTFLDLQGSAGNAAVVAMLAEHDIQPKLTVGAVHDPAEADADRMADAALKRMSTDAPAPEPETAAPSLGRRMARRLAVTAASSPNEAAADALAEDAGRSIPANLQASLEADLDMDLAHVRIHENVGAETIGAQAATRGSDIYFASAMSPELMVHELTHVTQMRSNASESGESETDDAGSAGSPGPDAASSAAGGAPAPTAETEASESETEEAPVSRMIRRKEASDAPGHGLDGGPVEADTAQRIEKARGGGKPLDDKTRTEMEAGFGADFSGIRMHQGGEADNLNRSLNAHAFTTGNDIFFSSGTPDKRILAHELAHTVQQGSAPTINRFMAAADFEKLTYESTFSMKGRAQKVILNSLAQYAALGTVKADPKKKGTGAGPTVPPEKLDNAIQLVKDMEAVSREYITAKQGAPDKKAKRFAGFVSFNIDCALELEKLNKQKAAATVTQVPVTVDSSGAIKAQQHYKGTLSSAMEKAGAVVNALAPNNGDSGEFTFNLDIPVSPGVFVGCDMKFEVKKDGPLQGTAGPTEIGLELAFKAGGTVGLAKIQGALGGYLKAGGKTPESALKLLSYGLYRRCKESSVIPSELSSKLWGGTADDKGKKKAESWSLEVEKEEFTDDDSYVETGGTASVKASGGVEGVLEGSGEVKGTAGKRHDKMSMDTTKGGAGKENTKGDNWFAQKSTGRAVESIELNAAIAALGIVSGDVKVVFKFESSGQKGSSSSFMGMEIEARARGQFPAGSFEAKLVSTIVDFIGNLKKIQNQQLQKASTSSQVTTGVLQAKGIADTTCQGLTGIPVADMLKKVTYDKLVTPEPTGAAKTAGKKGALATAKGALSSANDAVTKESKIGAELAYSFKMDGMKTTSTFDVRHLSSMSAKIPVIMAAELTRRKRLLGGKSVDGGEWTWVY